MPKKEINVVKMLRIEKPFSFEDRKIVDASKVNPRVTPKQAVEALKRYKGGDKIIEMLKKEGKKI